MWIIILCFIVLLLLFSDCSLTAAVDAIELIAYTLVPSLFPFFVLTNLLTRVGKISLLTGFFCGYPSGAMACAQLYQTGKISKNEALRYSMFTSNAGPSFLISAIGIGMCASKAIGFLLLGIHLAAAFTVALIAWRCFPKEQTHIMQNIVQTQSRPLGMQLTEAITIAIKQIGVVCGYVLIFSVLLGILQALGINSPILFSLLEITTGMNSLLTPLGSSASMPALLTLLPFVAVLLGFSGLCIHAQIIAILNNAGLPARFFTIGKILQAFFSGLYTYILLQIPSIYNLLLHSSITTSVLPESLSSPTSAFGLQLLLVEITLTLAVYCGDFKQKLKQRALL